MRAPLEYGDNFPVPTSGSWNPAVPWRFPRPRMGERSLKGWFPWMMLGVGLSLGILLMLSMRSGGPVSSQGISNGAVEKASSEEGLRQEIPTDQPIRFRRHKMHRAVKKALA